MAYHTTVLRPFLWHNFIEGRLHVGAHVGVRILVDRQRGCIQKYKFESKK